jgi:hypothetical protein
MAQFSQQTFLGSTPITLFQDNKLFASNPYSEAAAPLYPIVGDGLLVYLDVGNSSSYPGSGTTWTDLTGNGYNATLVNTPTYSSSDGGYLDFNGTNQYATVYGFPGSTFSSGNWTVQCWSYWDALDNKCLLSQGTTTNNGGLHLITRNVSGTNRYLFGMFNNDMTSDGVAVTGAWKFTTWTYNDTTGEKQLYVQSTLDKAQTQNLYTGTDNNTEIGRIGWNGTNTYYFDGRIAQMYIYNKILSSTEITANYDASKARYGL